MVTLKSPSEFEENEEFLKIEDTINDMVIKLIEEDDPRDSLDFGHDEKDNESLNISRISTRHQTSDFPLLNNFNRPNKRNLTEVLNRKENFHNFNSKFLQINRPVVKKSSFFFQNNKNAFNGSHFSSSNFNNYLNTENISNNNIQNVSLPPFLSFNSQFNNSAKINNNNLIRKDLPYSKTVVCDNYQRNIFNNDSQLLFNLNKYVNDNSRNIINGYDNHNDFCSNFNSNNFKRREDRKKTYEIPNVLKNNMLNYLTNSLINNNSRFDNSLIINNDFGNTNDDKNNCNSPINDNFIQELKNILDKNGKIDLHIYNLIKGKFLSILKNHKGSKLLQKYLKPGVPEEIIHLLYIEISQNLSEFITDGYSNYFCKKFYAFLSIKDRIDFLQKIENSMLQFSCDKIGTYPIQTIIENLKSNVEKSIVINAIKSHIEELSNDPYGCHVLERLLTFIEEENISFLYSYISDNFLKLAINSNGICLVKKILTFIKKQNLHEKIKQLVKENALGLIKHQCGNFVIQGIVECWNDYREIIELYKNNFISLSLEKYASNVIERFIEKDEEILNEFIDEIVKSNRIYEIMKSNYGNYVIQKVIKLAKNENKNRIVFCAAKNINNLMEIKLISKWKSILRFHINELSLEEIMELKMQNYFEN